MRLIRESEYLTLAPLTLLVGANSSGKSTFLRALPLLRQSVETSTNSPILWFGQFVDFGSLHDCRSRSSSDQTVSFGFAFSFDNPQNISFLGTPRFQSAVGAFGECKVQITLREAEGSRRTYLEAVTVTLGPNTASLRASASGELLQFSVNGQDIPPQEYALTPTAGLIPSLTLKQSDDPPATSFAPWHIRPMRDALFDRSRAGRRLLTSTHAHVYTWYHQRSDASKALYLLGNLAPGTPGQVRTQLESVRSLFHHENRFNQTIQNSARMAEISNRIFASRLPNILMYADTEISRLIQGISYIGPARAKGERYHRVQELSVEEVDSAGGNLPMFLQSLSKGEIASLNDFAAQFVGFSTTSDYSAEHLAVKVLELWPGSDGQNTNIIDAGFGYSQVLPLAVQLWARCIRPAGPSGTKTILNPILAIEQPELHLHPRLQASVADMLAHAILLARTGNPRRTPSLVVETHSEVLINRVGRLIRAKKLRPEDVAVYVFERAEDNSCRIIKARYNEQGGLLDWPIGFFSAEDLPDLTSEHPDGQ